MASYTPIYYSIVNEQQMVTLPDRLWRRTIELIMVQNMGLDSVERITETLDIDFDTLHHDLWRLRDVGILKWYYTKYKGLTLLDLDFAGNIARHFSTGHNPEWLGLRAAAMERDNHVCQYCGEQAEHVDHIIPRCQGGKDELDNLVAACAHCNLTKSGRTPEQAGMELL